MLSGQERQNLVSVPDVAIPAPNLSGEQNELSLLENLHPLTPQIAEDVEDTQAVECMTVNGTHASGVVYESSTSSMSKTYCEHDCDVDFLFHYLFSSSVASLG
ncbi:hypothetical protein AHAS_Ahas15G0065800 [Arachis hypogaea]